LVSASLAKQKDGKEYKAKGKLQTPKRLDLENEWFVLPNLNWKMPISALH